MISQLTEKINQIFVDFPLVQGKIENRNRIYDMTEEIAKTAEAIFAATSPKLVGITNPNAAEVSFQMHVKTAFGLAKRWHKAKEAWLKDQEPETSVAPSAQPTTTKGGLKIKTNKQPE